MLQYNTRLLDKSQYFDRAGGLGKSLGTSLRNIGNIKRAKKLHGMRQQAFQGYNPDIDPEGVNYRDRQKSFYNQMRGDWRTSDMAHEGLQAMQAQEIALRQQRVKDETDRLNMDSARIKNKMNLVKADIFKNSQMDDILTYMTGSPERYEAGRQELQKYMPAEYESLGLPDTFNKDAQAKILMRRGVSQRIKAINKKKLEELHKLEDRQRKIAGEDESRKLARDKFGFDRTKFALDKEKFDFSKEKHADELDYKEKQLAGKGNKALEKIKMDAIMDSSPQQAIVTQIGELKNLYKTLNEKGGSGLIGGAVTESPIGKFVGSKETQEARARFSTVRDGIVMSVMKAFEGARPSDKDREFYRQLIGSAFSNKDYFNAKVEEFEKMISGRIKAYNDSVEKLEAQYGQPLTEDQKTKVLDGIPLNSPNYFKKEKLSKKILQQRIKYGYDD